MASGDRERGGELGPPRKVRSFGRTDVGRVRRGNQDAYFHDDGLGLYVVADGMGGHAAGEVASGEALDVVHGMVKRGLAEGPQPITEARARRLLEGAIQGATYMLIAIGEVDHEKSGMGTTISAALFLGSHLVVGQVGDSRIYRVRDGRAEQLTEDHTLVALQLKQGLISPEEALVSPHRNVITRSIGNRDYVEVDVAVSPVLPGDRYLLCSDGLHGYLEDDEVAAVAALGGDIAVDAFIDLANARGGQDNITALLVEVS